MWGTWPVDELSLHIDEKTFNRLRPRGAFDAWIVQSQPPTNRQGQTDLAQQLKWFNALWLNLESLRLCSLFCRDFAETVAV